MLRTIIDLFSFRYKVKDIFIDSLESDKFTFKSGLQKFRMELIRPDGEQYIQANIYNVTLNKVLSYPLLGISAVCMIVAFFRLLQGEIEVFLIFLLLLGFLFLAFLSFLAVFRLFTHRAIVDLARKAVMGSRENTT